jgi:formylglycine-generating enzyme required for sulfatase activity
LVGIPTDTRVPRPTLPSIAAVTQPPANPGANPTVGVPPAPSALPPTATIGNTTIIGGAATPTLPPVTAPVIRTATGSEATPAGSSEAQAEFESIASPLIPLSGGEFLLGTTQKEATQAVTDCTSRDGGKCQLTDASDSTYPHFVTLNPFSIEKTEVSVSQYVAFLNTLPYTDTVKPHTNGCGGQPCFAIFDDKNKGSPVRVDGTLYKPVNDLLRDRPMVFVTWYGASSYCRALGRRLPTEAEWERSARRRLDGNNLSIYPWGDAWDGTLANSSRPPKNAAVSVTDYANGSSAEGVLNLAGNVGEWVSDWYGENYYRDPNFTALNPKGPTSGQQKVVRGGNWSTTPFFLRSVHRLSAQPLQPTITIGFRCAIDGAPPGVDVPSPPLPSNPGAPTAVGTLKP